jgi:hypothetical protein
MASVDLSGGGACPAGARRAGAERESFGGLSVAVGIVIRGARWRRLDSAKHLGT